MTTGGSIDPGKVALGFRRLSIIDLTGGAQPIRNETGRIAVTVNGEIYNFQALRRELEQRGHSFSTHSDAEVVVHLYEEHGVDCLSWLRGMFAIALWDSDRGRLFLARDRLGVKPLYYAEVAGGLVYGSEPAAILASGCCQSRTGSGRDCPVPRSSVRAGPALGVRWDQQASSRRVPGLARRVGAPAAVVVDPAPGDGGSRPPRRNTWTGSTS